MPSDARTLPSVRHRYADLPDLDEAAAYIRRETVFLILAGLFLGSLTMLNILGITRFIVLWDTGSTVAGVDVVFAVAIGVLPYPVTFLCTDFISELYGRARANRVVLTGFMLNVWVVLVLWVGGALPGTSPESSPDAVGEAASAFYTVRSLAFGAVAASMIAYLAAQLVDVHMFHFWKKLTRGRHLWLRNNGSTLVSQLVDTVAVILITHFYASALPIDEQRSIWPQLAVFIASGYVFKIAAALVDTIPFYLGAHWLARYLRLPPPTHDEPSLGTLAAEAGVG